MHHHGTTRPKECSEWASDPTRLGRPLTPQLGPFGAWRILTFATSGGQRDCRILRIGSGAQIVTDNPIVTDNARSLLVMGRRMGTALRGVVRPASRRAGRPTR